ncbi:CatA-like O-acetyltransferase [Desulfovibrio aminophilus]|uniref:CatA-like O-acetyltransferase n=1 Tax=Desulfovibrio aminophilus TaxID=81425 RepID=UPI00339A6184
MTMRKIDIEAWERKEHFFFFQNRLRPQVEVTALLDVTRLVAYRNALDAGSRPRLSDMLYFLAARAANGIEEFRQRIVERTPVVFDRVDVAFTYVPKGRRLHANCVAAYSERFGEAAAAIEAARAAADAHPTLTPAGGSGQGMLYFSIVPGLRFSSMSNPWGDSWADSVPRIIFGQVHEIPGGGQAAPVSVEVLHSFIDGRHIEAFFESMRAASDDAERTFA